MDVCVGKSRSRAREGEKAVAIHRSGCNSRSGLGKWDQHEKLRENKKKAGIGRIEKREIMQKREERRERICAVRQTQVVVVTRRANSGLDSG